MDLILVRGVSGAGKSTIAKLMCLGELREIEPVMGRLSFSTDNMFMVDGDYKFDPSKLGEYHAATVQKVKNAMLVRQDMMKDRDPSDWDMDTPKAIVVHNTFTEEWEMKPYFELAEEFNWHVHTIIVENRHGSKSIHDVPDDVVKAQKERFEVIL
jgi:adenylate kinase family enzyme|tara:strand:- start:212 stop:676 length:465 start_codon:yes stop_codon:yes gene_type:complete